MKTTVLESSAETGRSLKVVTMGRTAYLEIHDVESETRWLGINVWLDQLLAALGEGK